MTLFDCCPWIKWQSMLTCLVRAWWTLFAAKEKAALLSHYKETEEGWEMRKSWRIWKSHVTSQLVEVRARYSASAELRDTMEYFSIVQRAVLHQSNRSNLIYQLPWVVIPASIQKSVVLNEVESTRIELCDKEP